VTNCDKGRGGGQSFFSTLWQSVTKANRFVTNCDKLWQRGGGWWVGQIFFDSVTNLQMLTNTCKSDFKLVPVVNSTSSVRFTSSSHFTVLCWSLALMCCQIATCVECSLNVLALADAEMCWSAVMCVDCQTCCEHTHVPALKHRSKKRHRCGVRVYVWCGQVQLVCCTFSKSATSVLGGWGASKVVVGATSVLGGLLAQHFLWELFKEMKGRGEIGVSRCKCCP
jgi:hypothetical protein